MSNDNKTLADVQPGGAVRLGNGWTGWATQYPGKMPKLYGAREIAEVNHHPDEGQRLFFLSENPVHVGNLVDAARAAIPFVAFAYSKGMDAAEEAGRAIEAALSAQPSPAGQGDALLQEVCSQLESLGCGACIGSYAPMEDLHGRIAAHLAARKPVGQNQWKCEACGCTSGVAGEPSWTHERTAWIAEAMFTCDKCDNEHYIKLWDASPAQAVDLGAVSELLRRRMAQWRSHLPADIGAPGTREIETKGEHDYNNDVRIYREGIVVMDEVLALIDSKGVGK